MIHIHSDAPWLVFPALCTSGVYLFQSENEGVKLVSMSEHVIVTLAEWRRWKRLMGCKVFYSGCQTGKCEIQNVFRLPWPSLSDVFWTLNLWSCLIFLFSALHAWSNLYLLCLKLLVQQPHILYVNSRTDVSSVSEKICTLHTAGSWNFCSDRTHLKSTIQPGHREPWSPAQSLSVRLRTALLKISVTKLCPLINLRRDVQRGSIALLCLLTVWYQRGASIWEIVKHEWNTEQQKRPGPTKKPKLFFFPLTLLLSCLPALLVGHSFSCPSWATFWIDFVTPVKS